MERDLEERLVLAFENIADALKERNDLLNDMLTIPSDSMDNRCIPIILKTSEEEEGCHIKLSGDEEGCQINIRGDILNDVGINSESYPLRVDVSGDLDLNGQIDINEEEN